MAKLTEKEIQLRALREARQSSRGDVESRHMAPVPQARQSKGTTQPVDVGRQAGVAPGPREAASIGEGPLLAAGAAPKFDRNAYQREYMRKRRARQAEQRQKEKP